MKRSLCRFGIFLALPLSCSLLASVEAGAATAPARPVAAPAAAVPAAVQKVKNPIKHSKKRVKRVKRVQAGAQTAPAATTAAISATVAAAVPAAVTLAAPAPAAPVAANVPSASVTSPPSLQQNPYLQAYLDKPVQANPYLSAPYPPARQPVTEPTAVVVAPVALAAPVAVAAPAAPVVLAVAPARPVAASLPLPQITLAQPGTISNATIPFPPLQLPFQTWGAPMPAAVVAVAPVAQPAASPSSVWGGLGNLFGSLKLSLPDLPLSEQSILPKIQTVYPTGEKPLVVVTFKCPTELIGVDTPSTLILHKLVNGTMDLLNRSNLLSFNLQQVCA